MGKRLARVVATKALSETFGATSITSEINQRYGKKLRRPADSRTVATALRRMAAAARILQIEKGRGPREGVYSRGGGGSRGRLGGCRSPAAGISRA